MVSYCVGTIYLSAGPEETPEATGYRQKAPRPKATERAVLGQGLSRPASTTILYSGRGRELELVTLLSPQCDQVCPSQTVVLTDLTGSVTPLSGRAQPSLRGWCGQRAPWEHFPHMTTLSKVWDLRRLLGTQSQGPSFLRGSVTDGRQIHRTHLGEAPRSSHSLSSCRLGSLGPPSGRLSWSPNCGRRGCSDLCRFWTFSCPPPTPPSLLSCQNP